jgi:hypothetical protein
MLEYAALVASPRALPDGLSFVFQHPAKPFIFCPTKFGNMFKAVCIGDNAAYRDLYDVNQFVTTIVPSWIGKRRKML